MNVQRPGKITRPKAEQPVIEQHCGALARKKIKQVVRNGMRIDGRAQHGVEAVVTRMNQRSAKPAKRSQTGLGPVRQHVGIL